MTDVSRLSRPDCARALGMLAQFYDGDLLSEEAAWLSGHFDICAACRAARSEFGEMDSQLVSWGEVASLRHPPPPSAREQLASRMRPSARRVPFWLAPIAAGLAIAFAAGLAVMAVLQHRQQLAVSRESSSFVEIPYLPPLDPRENTTVVRMNIKVQTLIAAGYKVTAGDPNATVAADVLVGEDGRAQAVCLLPDLNRN